MGTLFSAGIGVHFGSAFIGHLGHPRFRQFSVIGDPVNTASRIQAYTRVAETRMLISGTVAEALPRDSFRFGRSFRPELKGLGEAHTLHELLGFREMDVALELQTTLDVLLADADAFAGRFYDNLFRRDPALRDLFSGDMVSQGRMMTHMLTGVVYGLSRPEFLISGLQALGRNHVYYGVREEHYPLAKEAFMETIRATLGTRCSEETEHAWEAAMNLVIDGMQQGARRWATRSVQAVTA